MEDLTPREKIILSAVIQQFINHPAPVSSSLIAQKTHLGMSPASIRLILTELEKKGYLYQPHTSAGRIPTARAYRLYVDNLMRRARLSEEEKQQIRRTIHETAMEMEEAMKEATRILAHLSHQLGIVISPHLDEGIFQHLEIVPLSSERILVIITVRSGLVKSIRLELPSVNSAQLEMVSQILNERLYGLKLAEIRKNFAAIVRDLEREESGIIRLFIETADRIFDFEEDKDVYFMGTHYIVQQPEFSDIEKFTPVAELLEDRQIIISLLDSELEEKPINIKIGEEIREQRMRQCSIIVARYRIGNIPGTLGILGPMRMDYRKLIPLVDFTARTLTEAFEKN